MTVDERCDAHHDGHDCRVPGACQRALLAMCERLASRSDADDPDRRVVRDLEAVA